MVLLPLKEKATSTMRLEEQKGIGFKKHSLGLRKTIEYNGMEKDKKSVNTLKLNDCLG